MFSDYHVRVTLNCRGRVRKFVVDDSNTVFGDLKRELAGVAGCSERELRFACYEWGDEESVEPDDSATFGQYARTCSVVICALREPDIYVNVFSIDILRGAAHVGVRTFHVSATVAFLKADAYPFGVVMYHKGTKLTDGRVMSAVVATGDVITVFPLKDAPRNGHTRPSCFIVDGVRAPRGAPARFLNCRTAVPVTFNTDAGVKTYCIPLFPGVLREPFVTDARLLEDVDFSKQGTRILTCTQSGAYVEVRPGEVVIRGDSCNHHVICVQAGDRRLVVFAVQTDTGIHPSVAGADSTVGDAKREFQARLDVPAALMEWRLAGAKLDDGAGLRAAGVTDGAVVECATRP